jgi:hypothetical protein
MKAGVQGTKPNEPRGSSDSLIVSSAPDDFFWEMADLGDIPLFDGGLLLTGPEDQGMGTVIQDSQLGSVPDIREFEHDSQYFTFS